MFKVTELYMCRLENKQVCVCMYIHVCVYIYIYIGIYEYIKPFQHIFQNPFCTVVTSAKYV